MGKILESDIDEVEQLPQDEEGIEETEEIEPEAFIPTFTVAPDEIPIEAQVPPSVPTQDEKAKIEDSFFASLGVKAKDFINSPPQEMTPEKEKFVHDSSQLVARGVSVVLTWVFMLLGVEYGVLAPTENESDAIVRPLMNVWARHSKVVAQISPDYVDIGNAIKGLSDYTANMLVTLQAIREDKAQYGNNRRSTPGRYSPNQNEVRTNDPAIRHPDNEQGRRGDRVSTNGSENGLENNGDTFTNGNLTADEQYQYNQLSILAQRDYNHRVKQSGRI